MKQAYNPSEIVYALKEEIGDYELFSGRKEEINYIMAWTEKVRKEAGASLAIVARRKKGKTALLQRIFNILFTMNDQMIVPFYYRIKEEPLSQISLADDFYHTLISQYAACIFQDEKPMKQYMTYSDLRELFKDDPEVHYDIKIMEMFLEKGDDSQAWAHAAYAGHRISDQKNKRIIQLIDEFQYLNKYIYKIERGLKDQLPLCGTYHHVSSSTISPTIVSGSCVTLLMDIITGMSGRFINRQLGNLSMNESLETVYNYSRVLNMPVTMETAAYMAKLSEGVPFYIATFFKTDLPNPDLKDMDCIDRIIMHETRTDLKDSGRIAGMWLEYLKSTVKKVNDKNGKKIILYLAKQGDQEKTRQEIVDDLGLELSDSELEEKLEGLISADIISHGDTMFDYRGPGDRFFEIVFKRMYQKEIDNLNVQKIRRNLMEKLISMRGVVSNLRGEVGEYNVRDIFIRAGKEGQSLRELVHGYIEGYELSDFTITRRKKIALPSGKVAEVDLYLESNEPGGQDYVVEVKNWARAVNKKVLDGFIARTEKIRAALKDTGKKTGFIFFSKKSLTPEREALLISNSIMIMYGE